jgi:hypothetical protein
VITLPSDVNVKFVALHEAFLENGAFVYVPRNVTVDLPLGVFHYASGTGTALFPHTLVVAEENAQVTIADFFRSSTGAGAQFACGGNDLYAGHSAQVTYLAMQDWSRETLSFQFNATVARRDTRVLSINLHAGARQARHESFSHDDFVQAGRDGRHTEARDFRTEAVQPERKPASLEAGVPCQQHALAAPEGSRRLSHYHCFQGAVPSCQSPSSTSRSRGVSMGCQKPR